MLTDVLLRRVRRAATGDSGVVLAAVLITSLVLSLLATALLVYVTQQMPQARDHQDRQAALAAAEAAVEDYLQRINADPEYFLKGTADPTNPAFSGFVPLPGSQDDTAAFRIDDIDIDSVQTRGVIVVSATGQVGGEERSIRVELDRKKFTDYAYLSDLEVNDPRNAARYPKTYQAGGETVEEVETRCGVYDWMGRQNNAPTSQDDNCQRISWTKGDVVNGKLHTNDLLGISSNPHFDDIVESGCVALGCGDKSGSIFKNYRGNNTATFRYPQHGNGFGVAAAGIVEFPKSNQALRAQTQAPNKGCLFTGPTRIVLRGAVADVFNRNSRDTNGPDCGGNYTTKSGVGYKHTIPMTADGLVIYVQDVPASSADPNYTASGSVYSTAPFIPGTRPANSPATYLPCATCAPKSTPDDFPLPEDKAYTELSPAVYGATQGDVLIEGTLDGRLTVGAEDDVIITGDLLQQDTEGDVLGLIANNFLWNYHPVNSTSETTNEAHEMCGGACMHDLRIEASIMSVKHAYGTIYPSVGKTQGTITTRGSLVQKWRNNVGDGGFGTSSHRGYAKKYGYDPQLRYTQPPHFLQPESLAWAVDRWAET